MATGWDSTVTKENINFARLCKLLIDGGTHALRHIFDAKQPPHDLKKHLMDRVNHGILKNLKAKRVLRTEQWNKLYPSVGIATSASFDITLLTLLLRNICNLPAPVKGWDEEPAAASVNVEDDVVRLRLYRNKLYGHISEPALSDADFNKYWNDIEAVLLRHGISNTTIDSLKTQPFDLEDENYYIKCLKEWITDEADRVIHAVKESEKRVLDTVKEEIDSVKDKLAAQQSRKLSKPATSKDAEVYSQKLKEAIINQTELQLKGIIDESVKTDDIFTNLVVHHGDKRCPEQIQRPQENHSGRKTLTEIKQVAEIFVNKQKKESLSFIQSLYEKFRKQRPQEKDNPKRIIVSGEPGVGKTLFSQKLLRDLAKNSISIPDIKFTYLIPFRQLNSLDQDLTLQELLNLSPFLDDATMIDDALMEYFIQHSEQILIVLDGFDEYKTRETILEDDEGPNDGKVKKPVAVLVRKLLQKKILSDSVIVVASRPGDPNEIDKKIHFDRYVEISGFSKSQIIEYVKKYFSTKPEEIRNKAVNEVKGSAHYISFGRVPFRCLLMCVFLEWKIKNNTKHDNSCPLTITEFYIQVMNCIERYYNRAILSLDDKAASLAVDKTLDNFAKLAAYLAEQNRFSFTLQDLKNLELTETELLQIRSSSLIFRYPISRNNFPFQKPICEYSFTHFTIQEFFLARYLVKKGVMAAHRNTEMVYIFMSGLLGLDNNDKLMLDLLECLNKHVKSEDRLSLVSLRCLNEYGQDKSLTRQQLTTNALDHRYWDYFGISLSDVTDSDCSIIAVLVESSATSISSLYRLSISGSLTSTGLDGLLPCLVLPNCTITELRLSHCGLGDEGVQSLYRYLPNTKITYLDLSWNQISDGGMKHYMKSLQTSNLTKLRLEGNRISDVGVQHIAKCLPTSKLTHLHLEDNRITDDGMKHIAKCLPTSNLTKLDLSWNKISDDGVKHIAKCLPNSKLTELHLANNKISDDGVEHIAKCLPTSYLTYLDLANNKISDDGVKHIVNYLPTSYLTYLDLDNNKISDDGVEHIAKCLPTSNLTELDLSGNQISDVGVEHIAKCLPTSNLTELHLANNLISDVGVKHIAKCLPTSNLTHLDLANNLISDVGVQYIAKCLPTSNLTDLNLSNSKISDKCRERTKEFCKDNYPGLILLIY